MRPTGARSSGASRLASLPVCALVASARARQPASTPDAPCSSTCQHRLPILREVDALSPVLQLVAQTPARAPFSGAGAAASAREPVSPRGACEKRRPESQSDWSESGAFRANHSGWLAGWLAEIGDQWQRRSNTTPTARQVAGGANVNKLNAIAARAFRHNWSSRRRRARCISLMGRARHSRCLAGSFKPPRARWLYNLWLS